MPASFTIFPNRAYSDFTSADLIGNNQADTAINTYTQELRIASDFDGMFNFLLGGFYFKHQQTQARLEAEKVIDRKSVV